MSRLSVVIVNYNTRDLLRNCLLSLRDSTLPAEIIVVDNASDDGSAEMVAAEFPNVRLLAQTENRWFCGGNNLGISAATGEYVLLLNPDTTVKPDALATLVDFMDANPDYAGATAQLQYPDGRVQRTCSRVPSYAYLLAAHTPLGVIARGWRARLRRHHWYVDEGFDRTHSRDVAVMPGSCLLMRRNSLWLNERLRLYYPEDDLGRRFAGQRFRFVAAAQVIHHEKAATANWDAQQVYFSDLMVYTWMHHGSGRAVLLLLLSRPLWVAIWLRQRLARLT